MLERDNEYLKNRNIYLNREIQQLRDTNKVLSSRQFNVDAFCNMHSESISAIAHAVTDLRTLLKR